MRPTIVFPPEAVWHALTHFEALDGAVRQELVDAGFDDGQVDAQLRLPGSKFFASFATSPQAVVARLETWFPERFDRMQPDAYGRIRLSFECIQPVGSQSVVDEQELTCGERQTIRREWRNGCPVRTVRMNRVVPACMCQLILAPGRDGVYFCTVFPGELAPPLPRSEKEAPDPYWQTHLFVR